MKRCPQCNRVETDEALKFCRVDGATLVSDSWSLGSEAGTAQLGSQSSSSEIETTILPHKTDADINRATAPTTVLPPQPASSTTSELSKPKRRKTAIAIVVIVTALVAATSAIVVNSYLSKKGGASIQSIAVLPLVNTSGDANTEYLSDGLTDSIINNLSTLPNLRVMSLTSVLTYKGKPINPQAVGRDLNVRAVLTGRLLQRGDDLSISVELVNAEDNSRIWGSQYNRKLSEIIRAQEEISRDISEKLRLRLSGAEEQRLVKHYTENNEAYQLYLKGRYYTGQVGRDEFRKSIDYYRQALDKDPSFALAYAWMSVSSSTMSNLGYAPPKEVMPEAEQNAQRALALDDTLAEAHYALARVRLSYNWDWTAAQREFTRAIDLNPNQAAAHYFYALYLQSQARMDEALAEAKRGLQLDPLSISANNILGFVLKSARQYDQAIEVYRKAIELYPNSANLHGSLGDAYQHKGKYDDAVAEYLKANALDGDSPEMVEALRAAYTAGGVKAFLQKQAEQLKEESKRNHVPKHGIAEIYAVLGDKDQAFDWLNKAYEERDSQLIYLRTLPDYDNLRSDPRFADLLRRMGLAQ